MFCLFFRLHDYDNNTKLDGLEILKALTHLVPYQPETEKPRGDEGASAEQKLKKEKEEELQYYMGEYYYEMTFLIILSLSHFF